jgi:tripartite-type tricarboxylate transporter receptor subunit TctC
VLIDYLNAALRKSLSLAEVRERLENQGYEVVASTPEVFGEWIRTETSKWSRIIREQKITLD